MSTERIVLMIRDPQNLHLTRDIEHIWAMGIPREGEKLDLYMGDGRVVSGDREDGKTHHFRVLEVIHLGGVDPPVSVQVHVREIY